VTLGINQWSFLLLLLKNVEVAEVEEGAAGSDSVVTAAMGGVVVAA